VSRRLTASWPWAALAALVIVLYLPVLRAGFVNWDDDLHVYGEPCVTGALARCWVEPWKAGYYPLTYSTFHVEWRLGGGAPWLFHLDNVLLHATNAVLVGHVAAALGLAPAASIAVASLWALHPVQVASVAWVTERKNTLYACLWLLALLAYLRGTRRARGLSLLLFVGAIASKNAAAATLPVAIVVVEWARGRALDRRLVVALVPYVALALAAGLVQVAWLPAGGPPPPLAIRVGLAARALWFYVGKFVWPVGLVPIYPRWSTDGIGGAEHRALAVLVAAAATLAALHRVLPRLAVAGLALFALNAAPIVGIVWFTFFNHSVVSDHFAYLPFFGVALASVVAVYALLPERTAAVALGVWCVGLALLTWRQIPVWHDSETLWTYVRAHNPSCFVCALNLGNARLAEGRSAAAEALYAEAARLDPTDERPPYNLGNLLAERGDFPAAIARYRDALRLAPDSIDVHNNLGVALARAGRPDEAEAEFAATLRLAPEDRDAHTNLGELAAERGDWGAAATHYAIALRSQPDSPGTIEALATALSAAGRVDEAIRVLRDGIAHTPDAAKLAGALAWILSTTPEATRRNGAEAVRLAERASALTGSKDPDLLDTLAAAYAETGRFDAAVATARRALAATEPDSELAANITRRIAVYEGGKPYRDE